MVPRKDDGKVERVNVRLPEPLAEHVRRQSKKTYTNRPEYIRRLIVQDMEKTNG